MLVRALRASASCKYRAEVQRSPRVHEVQSVRAESTGSIWRVRDLRELSPGSPTTREERHRATSTLPFPISSFSVASLNRGWRLLALELRARLPRASVSRSALLLFKS